MTRKIQWHIMVKGNSYKQNRKNSTVKTNISQKKGTLITIKSLHTHENTRICTCTYTRLIERKRNRNK